MQKRTNKIIWKEIITLMKMRLKTNKLKKVLESITAFSNG